MENCRWGLCIDIEGFSNLYEYSEQAQTKAIIGLRELMEAIFKIASNVYPGTEDKHFSERLFANQFGDGFVITSNYCEESAERCVAIATSLMRHMLMKGFATKVAISTGGMSDINGCYPECVRETDKNRVSIGHGVMTTIPVMGTALTRSHKLLSCHSGSVLILDMSKFNEIPNQHVIEEQNGIALMSWYNDDLALANEISEKADLLFGNSESLRSQFEQYIQQDPRPPASWVKSTKESWKN